MVSDKKTLNARWTAGVCLALLFFAGFAVGQSKPATVFEGIFGGRTSSGKEPALKWTIIRNGDRSLTIRVSDVNAPEHAVRASIEYHVSSSWKLLDYMLKAKSDDPINTFSLQFSCAFQGTPSCAGGSGKSSQLWSVPPVDGPALIAGPEEVGGGEITWGTAIALHSAKRIPGAVIYVPVISVKEDADRPKLAIMEIDKFTYIGKQMLALPFGKVEADVFDSGDSRFWMAPSGLPLAMSDGPQKEPVAVLESIERGTNEWLPKGNRSGL